VQRRTGASGDVLATRGADDDQHDVDHDDHHDDDAAGGTHRMVELWR
jgi:hypothetical protein